MKPGMIRFRGYAIEELIGRVGFADMVWLMTRGELPHPAAAKLLEAALVAAVDHGPQAPSIAAARMAVTCGVGINNAMASAINMLGDVHGGAGEQCVALYNAIAAAAGRGRHDRAHGRGGDARDQRAGAAGRPPRAGLRPPLPSARSARAAAAGAGRRGGEGRAWSAAAIAAIGRAIEAQLAERAGRAIPMNIDGATGVVFAELGFAPPLCRGLFVLSRSVGALAHAYEEMQSGERNKGPIPRHLTWTYTGPPPRDVPDKR